MQIRNAIDNTPVALTDVLAIHRRHDGQYRSPITVTTAAGELPVVIATTDGGPALPAGDAWATLSAAFPS